MWVSMQVCGYRVPRGTTVMFPVWALHHNRHVWGKDALQWNPDRWLQGGTVAAVKKAADGNPRFLPFLGGPSNCIGQHLALVRMTRPLERLKHATGNFNVDRHI